MQKIFLILFLVSILIVSGCQVEKQLQDSDDKKTTETTPESLEKDLQETEDLENIDDIEVLIDENTL